jgi:carboxyl-terminal processing protease
MTRRILFMLISFLMILHCFGQLNASDQAYEKAQGFRSQARKLYDKENASDSDVRQGISILDSAVSYLKSAVVLDLARGNLYLNARLHDVYFDLVTVFLIHHDTAQALSAFEKMANQGSYAWIEMFEQDSLYLPIRSDNRFAIVINRLKKTRALWEDEALRTGYQTNLTNQEKFAGLSLLWSQAKYNFANFSHADINWDQCYLDYLAQITATKSTIEYYRLLQKFYAQLKDGHSNVYFPEAISKELNSRPPIRTELIEGKVFVTDVFSASLKKDGIMPGLEILQIDDQSAVDYARQFVEPYQSSSTPQDLQVREFSYALLSGAEDKPVKLELKNAAGKIWTKSVARSGYSDVQRSSNFTYKTIENIGYLVINDFEDESITSKFDSLFGQISLTKGLIIDIRNNGGGSSNIGYHILSALTDKSFKSSAYKIPRYISIPGVFSQWNLFDADDIKPSGKMFYKQPVILLISARTFSAAEDFAVAFDFMKRGKLIGQTTGGSTGQPISFDLPGGGSARICGKHDTYPDGKEFVGIGVIPDIQIDKKIKDVIEGKDQVLLKALEIFK